ncbi:glycosyltransferase [Photobacterium damselae]|uniref:glycosyltransferase n=1 Tax=Photobacterium damselae TaxID=38293 RepID=UPI0025439CEB
MRKIVYISSNLKSKGTGGGVVSCANLNILMSIYGDCNVKSYDISKSEKKNGLINKLDYLINYLLGYSAGLTPHKVRDIMRDDFFIKSDVIYLDGSLFGNFVDNIKKKYPQKKIIVFFHNIETDFIKSVISDKAFIYKLVYLVAKNNEKKSAILADYIITLTHNDSSRLSCLFSRRADFIWGVSLPSRNCNIKNNSNDILFVGSDFPPNIEALNFLTKDVMPFIKNRKLIIIGKGLDKYKSKYDNHNVETLGFVENIDNYYCKSNIVLSPIFSGAGMKVKIAEALSYGKIVMGTSFSFVGYNLQDNSDFLIEANTAKEYIELLKNSFDSSSINSKKYFDDNLSIQAANKKLYQFLDLNGLL